MGTEYFGGVTCDENVLIDSSDGDTKLGMYRLPLTELYTLKWLK